MLSAFLIKYRIVLNGAQRAHAGYQEHRFKDGLESFMRQAFSLLFKAYITPRAVAWASMQKAQWT